MFDYNCDTCALLVLSFEVEHPCAAGKLQGKAWRTKHSNMVLQAYIHTDCSEIDCTISGYKIAEKYEFYHGNEQSSSV
jgi:hypothetical protein